MHALLILLNELDRARGPGLREAFFEDHEPALDAAPAAIKRALECGRCECAERLLNCAR